MPFRSLLLPLLLPPLGVALLLMAWGHEALALHAAWAAGAGALGALLTMRGRLNRQLSRLARRTRQRAQEREKARALDPESLEEVASVEGAIESLHAQLDARNQRMGQEQQTLTAVLDSMAEGIWVTDVHGQVVRSNAALRTLLSPLCEPVGQPPLAVLRHEGLHEAVRRACQQAESTQLELRREGPPPRILRVRVAPLGQGLTGSAAVFRDVTELRRLEKVRTDFVANVSHELRTPITAIRGYAETLQAGALEDAAVAPGMVDIILRQAERLSELVEDLLELSRLESGEVQLRRHAVSLQETASRAAEALRPLAAGKNIHVTLDVPVDLRAQGDARAVEQVLVNLVENAVKYTPAGGQVQVTGRRAGKRTELCVRDNGPGIEAHHLARIFERFYRIDKGRGRDSGGTGLGLSIVKHLVNAMGGEVEVSSRANEGTTFTLFLLSTPHEATSSE